MFSVILILLASLLLCKVLVVFLRPLGQPDVVVEICVGVGAGLAFGLVAPHLRFLTPDFPLPTSLLTSFTYPALIVYMLCLGYEARLPTCHGAFGRALSISAAGFVVPMALTFAALSFGVTFGLDIKTSGASVLLIAAIVGLTAFPVLCRILDELRLVSTELGRTAVVAAAVEDAFAWVLLAVLTRTQRPFLTAAVIAAALMFVLGAHLRRRPVGRKPSIVVYLASPLVILAEASALWLVGVDQVLIAFIVGLLIPPNAALAALMQKVKRSSMAIMPLFFIIAGMNAKLSVTSFSWIAVLCWTLWATITKGGAAYIAARVKRFGHHEALAIGALMNCRGIVAIVYLTIGFRSGLLSVSGYTVFLLVSLAATAMTAPIVRMSLARRASSLGHLSGDAAQA